MSEREDFINEDDALAAEYVLGVLDASAHAQLAQRVAEDAQFARLVTAWEQRLAGLNDAFEAENVPARVKQQLDARLFGAKERQVQKAKPGWLGLLTGWQRAAIGLAALAIVAVVIGLVMPQSQDGPVFVANLEAENGAEQFTVRYDVIENLVTAKQIAGAKPTNKVFELWLIADGQAPQSLGLLEQEGREPALSEAQAKQIGPGVLFAISREQPGGSLPGAGPSEVVAIGQIEKI